MIKYIPVIIESSDKVKKILVQAHLSSDKRIEMENEYIFLFNSIERYTQLSSSYHSTSSENYIAKIVLVRPLVLDSMLFLYLVYLGKNTMWDKFDKILNNCLNEGVVRHFYTLKRTCDLENMPKVDRDKLLNLYHYDYRYFFEMDSTIDCVKPRKVDFSIEPSKIESNLKNTECYKNAQYINNLYQVLSKYEHNTIVSLKLSRENNFESKIYVKIESIIFDGYLNLLKVIAKSYLKGKPATAQIVLDEYDKLLSIIIAKNERI